MTVVVVDDDQYVLRLLALYLTQLSVDRVVSCTTAQAALECLKQDRDQIGLVLCDLQMPEMDGIEFVRHLAQLGYMGSLVLASGENSSILYTAEKLAHAHGLHVLGTLQKPFTLDQMREFVSKSTTRKVLVEADRERKSYNHAEIGQAIEQRQLVNYYQPKVSAATGVVEGVEALVRWNHPCDGLVYPDQFITTAEMHGLIDDLTREVLRSALADLRAWRDAGHNLQVAVNISMETLGWLEFPEYVMREVQAAGVPPYAVTLEITESRLMMAPLAALDILARLSLKHFKLSIDDFGTGNSTLSRLRDIPFTELKIDQSFVHGACRHTKLRDIFEASLGMARQLRMNAVAEGVEDRADWNFVRNCNCDTIQGYFVARPMPGAALPEWIEDWHRRYPALAASAS